MSEALPQSFSGLRGHYAASNQDRQFDSRALAHRPGRDGLDAYLLWIRSIRWLIVSIFECPFFGDHCPGAYVRAPKRQCCEPVVA
jgi:hypothetical protein